MVTIRRKIGYVEKQNKNYQLSVENDDFLGSIAYRIHKYGGPFTLSIATLLLITLLYIVFNKFLAAHSYPWDPSVGPNDPSRCDQLLPTACQTSVNCSADAADITDQGSILYSENIASWRCGPVRLHEEGFLNVTFDAADTTDQGSIVCSKTTASWRCGPVRLHEEGFLNVTFDDAMLHSYLSQEQIVILQDYMEAELAGVAEGLLRSREAILQRLNIFIHNNLCSSAPPAPFCVSQILSELSDDQIQFSSMQEILFWLKNQNHRFMLTDVEDDLVTEPDTAADQQNSVGVIAEPTLNDSEEAQDTDTAEQDQPDDSNEISEADRQVLALAQEDAQSQRRLLRYQQYKSLESSLIQQMRRERQAFLAARMGAPNIEPPINFDWLHSERLGWLVHLVFWTWVGVIADAITGLFKTLQTGTYSARLFALTVPKFILAPFMSLILVALWTAGFTESGITFVSMPFLLFAFFAMGFANNRVVRLIRDAIKGLFRGFSLSEERLQAQYTQARKYRNQYTIGRKLDPPDSIDKLRTQLKMAAKEDFEQRISSVARSESPLTN